jgi:hypothetical protein
MAGDAYAPKYWPDSFIIMQIHMARQKLCLVRLAGFDLLEQLRKLRHKIQDESKKLI